MIQTHGVERPEGYTGNNTGTLPDGDHGLDFQYMFCCRNDGSTSQPLETLDITYPLILFTKYGGCQLIEGIYIVRVYCL